MIERRPTLSDAIPRRVGVFVGALCAIAALSLPPSSAADWIVTRDGARIETQGPWEQKGRLVVFTDAGGALRSLRASDVDAEASERATSDAETAAAAPAPEPEPEAPKRSVLVLTDADVNQVDPDEYLEDGAGAGGDGDEAPTASANALVVSNWDQLSQPEGGLLVSGTLVNNATYLATQIAVEVSVYDSEGTLVGQLPARLNDSSLQPSDSITFRAIFPDLVGIANATFRVTNRGFDTPATRPVDAGPGTGDGDDGADDALGEGSSADVQST